jgi:methyl-accepting chemotaxis protein
MSMTNWKLSHKLISAFSLVFITLCALAAMVMVNLSAIESTSASNEHSQKVLAAADAATKTMLDLSGQVRGYLLTHDEAFASGVEADQDSVHKSLGDLNAIVQVPDQRARVQQIGEAVDGYIREAGAPEIRLERDPATHGQALAIMASGANKKWMNAFKDAVKAFEDRENDLLAQRAAAQAQAIRTAKAVLMVGAVAALAISILMGWLLTRMIAAPIAAMVEAMKKLAGGDNSTVIPAVDRKDEVGDMAKAVQIFKDAAVEKQQLEAQGADQRRVAEAERARHEAERETAAQQQAEVVQSLATGLTRLSEGDLVFRLNTAFAADYEQLRTDFNAAMAKLEDTMTVVANNTAGIGAGADEIAQASDDLSRRTEQQAASLEETAAALDEITATVKKTAAGAKQASGVVTATKGEAEHSGVVVAEAVQAMGQIEQSSQQISQIIGVIDEIAFQTNLLALNAGVEAARAGDAGRGFAVVAQEVRALAQRSAEAAKEIKTLISTSSKQVGDGVDLVGQTGKALQSIVAKIGEIDLLVSEISASAQEQATGLNEVNTAVNQMDQVVQQNAAMVEQATAATHSLKGETAELSNSIARFKISGRQARPGRPAQVVQRETNEHARPARSPARAMIRKVAASFGAAAPADGDGWEEF